MKFKTLHLENYQAHKNTTVDLTAGLNIIIGESDMGKSSILRAIRKLVRDFPAGKDHINKDATSMKISLTVIDDNDHEYVVVRQVTPSKNLYYLDEQEFGGFGREIPEEIQNTLEMFVVELENSEKIDLHFSDQHDEPFMVSRGSAGTRSKLLGRIAGLHTLDKGIGAVNKDIRAGNSELKIKSADRDECQTLVDNAKNTSAGHILHTACTERLQEIAIELNTLSKLKDLYDKHSTIVSQGKAAKKRFESLPDIDVNFQKIREEIQRYKQLKVLQESFIAIEQKITSLPPPAEIDIDFTPVRETIQKLDNLQKCAKQLTELDERINTLKVMEFDIAIESTQAEWSSLLAELKICPTCKQSTTDVESHCKQL